MAAMYAVYHGPTNLQRIAQKVHGFTQIIKSTVEGFGYKAVHSEFFDTLTFDVTGAATDAEAVHSAAVVSGINLRRIDDKHVGLTLDESVGAEDVGASSCSSPSDSATPLHIAEGRAPVSERIEGSISPVEWTGRIEEMVVESERTKRPNAQYGFVRLTTTTVSRSKTTARRSRTSLWASVQMLP